MKSKSIIVVVMVFCFLLSASLASAIAPTAVTGTSTPGTDPTSERTVTGMVNANGVSTTVTFELGLSQNEYDSEFTATPSTVTGSTDTAVSALLGELEPGETYHYRVKAVNSSGTTYGADMTFTTDLEIPIAITGFATSVTASSATLNGSVAARGYDCLNIAFEYGTDTSYGSEVSSISTSVSAGNSISTYANITGLTGGTVYHYRIKADYGSETVYGEDVTFSSEASPPTVTTSAATSVESTSAVLNGTVNPNFATTAVMFDYGLDTEYGSITGVPGSYDGGTETAVSLTISELLPNTTYHYRIVGTNTEGTEYGADMTFTTSPVLPSATTGAASSVSGTGATLNGTINANNSTSTITFQYGTSTSYGTTVTANESPVTGTSNTAVTKSITGLTNGITYHFRVVAVNGAGTIYGGDQTFITGASAPSVTTGEATNIAPASASLNGSANANGTTARVYFEIGLTTAYSKTVSAIPETVTDSADTAVTYSLSGLIQNTTYHYRAVASNPNGTVYGADKTFTTLAAPTVTTGAVGNGTDTTAVLNGTVNANGLSTTVTFEYGTTTAYGTVATADQSPVSGTTDTAVSRTVTGLTPDTTYHYRAVGTSANGTSYGADRTFVTTVGAPTVLTLDVTANTGTSAVLRGEVNAKNSTTTVTFEYGPTPAYGTTVTADESPLSGSTAAPVSKAITGLTSGVMYFYRAVGTSTSGTTNGSMKVFTAAASLPSVTTDEATAVETTSATLNGTVSGNGVECSTHFAYGTTTAYGTTVPGNPGSVGANTSNVSVTWDISGLAPDTVYHYRLFAANYNGGSQYGEDRTFTTPAAPVSPTATTAAASGVSATTATLNGTVNANGTLTTVSFEYGIDASYGHVVIADQSPLSGSADVNVSVDLTGVLTPNTTYHFRIKAQNYHETVNGADMTFTTASAPPTATTSAATSISGTGATLNGTVNANNDSSTVTFEYGTTTSYGTTVTADQSPVTGAVNASMSKAVTGLTPGTTYHYRVVAQNSAGTSTGADMTFYTGTAAPEATTAAATAVGSTTATLNGIVNANNVSTTVTFEYGEDTTYARTVAADQSPVSGSADSDVTAAITGLIPDTTYHFRVKGQNAVGTDYGADMTFTTNPANTPVVTTDDVTGLTTLAGNGGGEVTDQGGAAVTARGVCWGTSSDPTTADSKTSDSSGTGTFTSSITGLAENTTYYIRAYATNDYGTVYGDQKTFTTLAGSGDEDNDGISNGTEDNGPNNGDGNGDNTPDSRQSDVISVPAATGSGYLTLEIVSGCSTLEDIQTYTETGLAQGNDVYYSYPYGLVEFTASCSSVVVRIYYSALADLNAVPGATYRKYGPQPPDFNNPSWYEFTGTTYGTADIGGQTVVYAQLSLADGELGDDTGADGTIYDQGGLASLNSDNPPMVTTDDVSSLTSQSGDGGGEVTDRGGAAVTARGVCWSTSSDPTTADSKTSDGSGTGTFTSSITGLTENTTYYIRAYATNVYGTAYGDQKTFTTLAGSGDEDNDGISNGTEDNGPNNGDGNGDGIPDSLQSDVTSVPAATGTGYLTLEIVSGCSTLEDIQTYAEGGLAQGEDEYYDYPYGLVEFVIPCSSAVVRIYYSDLAEIDEITGANYRKYGPVPPDFDIPIWYTLTGTGFGTADIGGQTVVYAELTLNDGELGDDTGVDGIIYDQGGLAWFNTIPTVNEWGMIILSILMGISAAWAIRKNSRCRY